jgi:hypothetical protein
MRDVWRQVDAVDVTRRGGSGFRTGETATPCTRSLPVAPIHAASRCCVTLWSDLCGSLS